MENQRLNNEKKSSVYSQLIPLCDTQEIQSRKRTIFNLSPLFNLPLQNL